MLGQDLGPEWAGKKPPRYHEGFVEISDRLKEKKGECNKTREISLKTEQAGAGSEKFDW